MSRSIEDTAAQRGRSWPWIVCAFLLFATLISYLDRQSFSVISPVIKEELRIDNERLGMVLSAFYLAYGLMHLFVGFFLDRFDIKRTYAAFVVLWSLAQMATGWAKGFGMLYGCRFALGIFEAAGQTGAARIIARIIPAKDRTLANSIMMSGSSVGAILAPPVIIGLNATVGWRMGFVILGGIGLLWAALWLLWFRPPESVLRDTKTAPGAGAAVETDRSWAAILKDPRFRACLCGAFFGIPLIHISGAWLPMYFIQTWGLKLNTDLAATLIIIYVGADVALVGSGVAISAFVRKGIAVGAARKRVLLVAGTMMAAVGFVFLAPSVTVAILLVLSLNMGRAAYGAIFLSFNQEICRRRVATIAGIMGAIGAFSGSAMVYIIGLITRQSGFGLPFGLIALFAVLGTIPLVLVNWDLKEEPR